MAVLSTKAEAIALWQSGALGNKLLSWPSVPEWRESGYAGNVVLRYKGTGGGGWCAYDVAPEEVSEVLAEGQSQGAELSRIYVNEFCPDLGLVLQGEVMQSEQYLSLRYSRVPKPMRVALSEEQHHVDGLGAVLILKSKLDAPSWDALNELLVEYPGAVIEFSTWDGPVGDRGWNTVFWEVRHY